MNLQDYRACKILHYVVQLKEFTAASIIKIISDLNYKHYSIPRPHKYRLCFSPVYDEDIIQKQYISIENSDSILLDVEFVTRDPIAWDLYLK